MFNNTNLREELDKRKVQLLPSDVNAVLDEAFSVLYGAYCDDLRIQENLDTAGENQSHFSWKELSLERIYSVKEIEKTCVAYRLRFLNSKQFKGLIPSEAISKIKALEKHLGIELKNFKIMAPSDRFLLEDCDKDPLLFVELGDGYHYLVHQWGNDMVWYRELVMWPLRSFKTLGITIASVSLIIAMIVPTEAIVGSGGTATAFARFAFFIWSLASITAIVTYIGFAFFKNLSTYQWNSPFLKQDF
jgi:hypothetical protein